MGLVTVERVRKRCIERGVEACLERKIQDNPSRPRKLDGVAEAKLVQIACSPPPPGRARWTLSLLADQLVELAVFDRVSISTIQGEHEAATKVPEDRLEYQVANEEE